MPIFELDDAIVLPAPENAEPDGLLAVGGDLRVERLVLAYATLTSLGELLMDRLQRHWACQAESL